MTILVTGGSGFIGGAIVRALCERGERVRVLARSSSKTTELEGLGVEIVRGDILDPSSVRQACAGCSTVYHAAAVYELWGVSASFLETVAGEGTRNVVNAARDASVDRLIYTSSSLVIGEPKGTIGTEATIHRGYFLTKYERAKYQAEQIVRSAIGKGLPAIIVNPAGTYGPGGHSPQDRFMGSYVAGKIPALFTGATSLVYLDDVARGHLLAAERGTIGARYILSGTHLTTHELAEILSRVSGAKQVGRMPNTIAQVVATVGELASRVTKQRPPIATEELRLIVHGHRVDGSKATRELGLQYIALEDGLRATFSTSREGAR